MKTGCLSQVCTRTHSQDGRVWVHYSTQQWAWVHFNYKWRNIEKETKKETMKNIGRDSNIIMGYGNWQTATLKLVQLKFFFFFILLNKNYFKKSHHLRYVHKQCSLHLNTVYVCFMISNSSAVLFVMGMAILWPISYIRKGKYRPANPTDVYVTLRVPPLDSATGWTGELWSNCGKLRV